MRCFGHVLFFVTGISFAFGQTATSKLLHIGTNPNQAETMKDIVNEGKATPRWSQFSPNPMYIAADKHIEYFYVVDTKLDLRPEYINLHNSDESFANSTVRLVKEGAHYYTIIVDYKCDQIGGTIVSVWEYSAHLTI
jgi:hypothetical protein